MSKTSDILRATPQRLSTTALVAMRRLRDNDELRILALRNGEHEPFTAYTSYVERIDQRNMTVPMPVFRKLCNLGLLERANEWVTSPGMQNGEGRYISEPLISAYWRLSEKGQLWLAWNEAQS